MTDQTPGTQVAKWADTSMFTAEKSHAADGPTAYLLGGPSDPLGQIVACINMYKGKVVRDLADVTEAERQEISRAVKGHALTLRLLGVSRCSGVRRPVARSRRLKARKPFGRWPPTSPARCPRHRLRRVVCRSSVA